MEEDEAALIVREEKLDGGDEVGGLTEKMGLGKDGRWGLRERLRGWWRWWVLARDSIWLREI